MQRFLTFLMIPSLLFVAGCADSSNGSGTATETVTDVAQEAESLLGIVWEWVSTITPVERFQAADPARYALRFQADGRVEAKFDCNSGSGTYEIAENRLSFGPLISTRMACPEDTQDALFMGQLQQISSYFLRDGELFLEMPVDSGTMRFRNGGDTD